MLQDRFSFTSGIIIPRSFFLCGGLLLYIEKYRHLRTVGFELIQRRRSGFTAPSPRTVLGWKFNRRSERVLPLGRLIARRDFGTENGEVPLFAIR